MEVCHPYLGALWLRDRESDSTVTPRPCEATDAQIATNGLHSI